MQCHFFLKRSSQLKCTLNDAVNIGECSRIYDDTLPKLEFLNERLLDNVTRSSVLKMYGMLVDLATN